jgi:membrane protein
MSDNRREEANQQGQHEDGESRGWPRRAVSLSGERAGRDTGAGTISGSLHESTDAREPHEDGEERGWPRRVWDIVYISGQDFLTDNGPQWAAAIAYYGLLSAFPLMLAIASIAAYFVDPNWVVSQLTDWVGEFMPQGEQEIEEIVQEAIDARGTVGLLSIGTLLWTGTRVFAAMTMALNIAFDVDEPYGFFRRLGVEFLMLLTLGAFIVIALSSNFLIGIAWNVLEFLPGNEGLIFNLVSSALPPLLLLLVFYLIYRLVPRRDVEWRAALPGALLATALYMIARPIFFFYIEQFGEHNIIYGSLAIVIIIIMWAWITGMILIFGGEVVSHIQAIEIEGKSPEEVRERHMRRSPTLGDQEEKAEEERRMRPSGQERRRIEAKK